MAFCLAQMIDAEGFRLTTEAVSVAGEIALHIEYRGAGGNLMAGEHGFETG